MWIAFTFFFSEQNTCELDIVLTRIVKILTTNELVKPQALQILSIKRTENVQI